MSDRIDLISETYHDAGYVVIEEITMSHFEDMPVGIISNSNAYTVGGDYIGSVKEAERLCDELGIYPEVMQSYKDSGSNVCSIGFSRKSKKWYGWSHRAIYGFSIGDTVKEGDCGASSGYTEEYIKEHPEEDQSLPVGFTAKTFEDCKRMAVAFSESVS